MSLVLDEKPMRSKDLETIEEESVAVVNKDFF